MAAVTSNTGGTSREMTIGPAQLVTLYLTQTDEQIAAMASSIAQGATRSCSSGA